MALTPSLMLPLGTSMPAFELPDTVSGDSFNSDSLRNAKGSVIMFICNHCPYVIHVQDEIVKIADDYKSKGIEFVAISSNDVANYPADAPDLMKIRAEELNFSFPYLYDESQEIAKAFQAACTPDFYLFDAEQNCTYRGRMDGSTPGNAKPVDGSDLRNAIDNLLSGSQIAEGDQFPSMGCNIKWK
ncbi:MAG: thioredoxin family protein [Bacteroidota bacterium]